ncbi:uncharacterized protein MCYG_02654 [Microsporum canis CBS 113480]|uniref:Uncharacterized protein n=1 Tax=Arthroderma otae (strain ATCC MYA-4605 / CBS 113480) TaxID=554155 RepID=C5FGF0_ARTOC|nr:uncharacterized protein MCYG_02654 [Microsporum canis CBS 113480]EEQ29835.1 predicted protein [Microsporum canis CBS 113480]
MSMQILPFDPLGLLVQAKSLDSRVMNIEGCHSFVPLQARETADKMGIISTGEDEVQLGKAMQAYGEDGYVVDLRSRNAHGITGRMERTASLSDRRGCGVVNQRRSKSG